MKRGSYMLLLAYLILSACSLNTNEKNVESDLLPCWNESAIKTSIIQFVKSVSDESDSNFVEIADRIAVFDNDGTLWIEKPLYIPIEYEIYYLRKAAAENPSLRKNKLYNGLIEGDLGILKEYSSMELIHQLFAAHKGQLETDYESSVYEFLSSQQHSRFQKYFKELTYLPMVELIRFLQANDFKVYIVTGGEITFVRTVSEEIYNIPEENVIGSNVLLKYVSDSTGQNIIRTGTIVSANDKQVKPANIELHIGKKPIFAAGNSDGDYQMMEYTLSGNTPSMAILVHHDDQDREYSYTHGTEQALDDAGKKGWYVVSMKDDFKTIFNE